MLQRSPGRQKRSGLGYIIGLAAILGTIAVLLFPHLPGKGLNFKAPPPPIGNGNKTSPTPNPNRIRITALFTGSPRKTDDAVVVYLTINHLPTKRITVLRSPWHYPVDVPITPSTLILVTVRNFDLKGKADCALTTMNGNSPFGNLDYATRTGGKEAAACSYPVPLGTPLGGR